MDYKGVHIMLNEYMPGDSLPLGALTYQDTVGAIIGSRPAYVAASTYGTAIATRPDVALADVKALIDSGLNFRKN